MEGEAALAPTEGSIWAVRLQRRPALGGPRSDAACLPAARQIQIPQTKRNRIMKLIFVWVCRHFGISQLHLPPDPAPAASSINLPPSHDPWIQSHSLGGQASPLSISNQAPSADPKSMAGGNKSTGNAARSRKRVEATILKRSRDGSAFTRWSVFFFFLLSTSVAQRKKDLKLTRARCLLSCPNQFPARPATRTSPSSSSTCTAAASTPRSGRRSVSHLPCCFLPSFFTCSIQFDR